MGRRGFVSLLNAVARDVARAQRQAERRQRQQVREQERFLRNAEREEKENRRLQAIEEKERHQRYLESRLEEVEDANRDINEQILEFKSLLDHALSKKSTVSFASLHVKEKFPPLNLPNELTCDPPKELITSVPAPQKETYLSQIRPLGFFSKLLPNSKKNYEDHIKQAEEQYIQAMRRSEEDEADRKIKLEKFEAERKSKIEQLTKEYEEKKKTFDLKVEQRKAEVNEFKEAYQSGARDAIESYNTIVLDRADYPENFPQKFRIAYLPDAKELVVDYQLPLPDVIPSVGEYKYVKSRDVIDEKSRKQSEIKELYTNMVASITLRTIHEVLKADQSDHLQVVVFSGFVRSIDPSTGIDIQPYLISVRTTRERFNEIDLSRIDKISCLKNLGAHVSPRPSEMLAVKPIIEFDMADKRFVDQRDILSSLDNRPNLMELNPFEFENLISDLFGKMGLEAKLTRVSRDGGVDVVAFDARPILGGKVVIQAKRYRNRVEVSSVRDLYGTMMNEGANKGILVTTSAYGPDAYDFVKDKPIELIDGGGLLYLLEQVGVQGKIIFPEQ